MDRQCPSCGGFCKKSGCERENVELKEWVRLTDGEKEMFLRWQETVSRVKAKLKEKNNG